MTNPTPGYVDRWNRVWCVACANLVPARRVTAFLPPHPDKPNSSDCEEVCEGCHAEFKHGGRGLPPAAPREE